MSSRSVDEAVSVVPVVPAHRAFTLPSWIGFVADLARATIAACAASIGVFLLVAYLVGGGAVQ